MRTLRGGSLAVAVAVSLPACFVVLDHELPADEQAEFVAAPADFAGFDSWPSALVGEAPAAAPHEVAERRVHINALPPDGASAFPVGTIIVKTGAGGELTGEAGDEIHAMVKRGAGFNADGARGWEYFEIALTSSDEPLLVWRGAEPPAGETYGCAPGQDCGAAVGCNECHVAAGADNDYVQSPALTLGAFDESLLGGAQ